MEWVGERETHRDRHRDRDRERGEITDNNDGKLDQGGSVR